MPDDESESGDDVANNIADFLSTDIQRGSFGP
jgi:hypothetical protein